MHVVVCTYEHCLVILSSGMSTINEDTQQRLRELITTIAIDEGHMIFDDSRDRVVNKLVELVRLIHIPLFLMTGTMHYQR
jgi:replicative superfamily II helicase